VQAIYVDRLVEALLEITWSAKPASHVGQPPLPALWIADVRHVGGPIPGAHIPFTNRQTALDAERQWLRVHLRI
jgi:hypothetical protein